MDIYHYHSVTGEYLGNSEALPDPLEPGRFLIPAHATEIAPPAAGDHEVAVFNGSAWTLMPDFRGTEYWLEDGSKHTISAIGEEVPEGASLTEPEPQPHQIVPQQVTRAQGKAALITAGLWSAVESYVDGIEDPTEKALALVALNDTTHWQRTSPFLNAAAAALGLTDEQLDDLFRQAAKIEL